MAKGKESSEQSVEAELSATASHDDSDNIDNNYENGSG